MGAVFSACKGVYCKCMRLDFRKGYLNYCVAEIERVRYKAWVVIGRVCVHDGRM